MLTLFPYVNIGLMFDAHFIQETLTPFLAIIGAVFGLIGTGIGLFNLWIAWKSHRTKLRVTVLLSDVSRSSGYSSATLEIRVVNLSSFPVTIEDVGLCRKTGFRKTVDVSHQIDITRLDARDRYSFVAYIAPENTRTHGWAAGVPLLSAEESDNAIRAYATLSDGTRFTSKSCHVAIAKICATINANPSDPPNPDSVAEHLGV